MLEIEGNIDKISRLSKSIIKAKGKMGFSIGIYIWRCYFLKVIKVSGLHKSIIHQTLANKGIWRDCRFVFNDPGLEECDAWFVFDPDCLGGGWQMCVSQGYGVLYYGRTRLYTYL